MSVETYHVTRVSRPLPDGRREAHGHSTMYCNELGCTGLEVGLGSYDPAEVDHDGEHFFATNATDDKLLLAAWATSAVVAAHLPAKVADAS